MAEHESDLATHSITIFGHAIQIRCTGTDHAWREQLAELLPGDLSHAPAPSTVIAVQHLPDGQWIVGEMILTLAVHTQGWVPGSSAVAARYRRWQRHVARLIHMGWWVK